VLTKTDLSLWVKSTSLENLKYPRAHSLGIGALDGMNHNTFFCLHLVWTCPIPNFIKVSELCLETDIKICFHLIFLWFWDICKRKKVIQVWEFQHIFKCHFIRWLCRAGNIKLPPFIELSSGATGIGLSDSRYKIPFGTQFYNTAVQ